MRDDRSITLGPSAHVVVVGAGIVGLSTATFLARRGVAATVVDRVGVAAGASWGNAGFLTPALATPLPQPSILRAGARALISPRSPLYVPLRFDPHLWRFLLGFTRNCTTARWRRGLARTIPLLRDSLAAFDDLVDGGPAAGDAGGGTRPAGARGSATSTPRDGWQLRSEPVLAACRSEEARDRVAHELDQIRRAGIDIDFELLDQTGFADVAPHVGAAVTGGVRLLGQHTIDPPRFMQALAAAADDAGVDVRAPAEVTDLTETAGGVRVTLADGSQLPGDAVVVATGAELGRLGRPFGVRRLVQAGRGYSFSVEAAVPVSAPTYFPSDKIVATPLADGRVRIAGMMEFRRHGAPIDPRRIAAIADAARRVLPAFDVEHRTDEWVGSRPVTTDGIPLIGPTRSPRVIAAGGHGMWGVVLGPRTGQLLARLLVEGTLPAELAPFDPLR